MSIPVTSITSNVLLAIGLPPSWTGGKVAPSRWPGPPRHARHPRGELRDRGGELRDRHLLKRGELRERRHTWAKVACNLASSRHHFASEFDSPRDSAFSRNLSAAR